MMPKGCRGAIVSWILVSALPVHAAIPNFIDEMFREFQEEYFSFREAEFFTLCSRYGLEPSDATNRQTFGRVYFLHDLLTTGNALDCAQAGFLRIPYFWHWVEPNPRHQIFALPDSVLLTTLKPEAPYRRYASAADIDRVPALFLGDLVAEQVQYFHPDCGSFFTFGWCSEREMAYTALMTAWGFLGKVWQSGIHTYSVVWCEFKTSAGATKAMAAEVDNTFNSLRWTEILASELPEHWLLDTGSGAKIDWYNAKARSQDQIDALRGVIVGERARERFRSLIRKALPPER